MNAKPKLTEPFTMSEYIAFHELGVSPNDAGSTRVISQHLRERGYTRQKVRRDKKIVVGWTRSPRPDAKKLQSKLKGI